MDSHQSQASVFTVQYPNVGHAGNLRGDDPIFLGCSKQIFWNRDTSLLVNRLTNGLTSPEDLIGKPSSFEDLVRGAANVRAPIEAWSQCDHIARYGGGVAARALKEIIENPTGEFASELVAEATGQLYRLAHGRVPLAFPEHILSRTEAREIDHWLEVKAKDGSFQYRECLAHSLGSVKLEPLEQALEKVGYEFDLARMRFGSALASLGRRIGGR